MINKQTAWIVIADSNQALFYTRKAKWKLGTLHKHMEAKPLRTDEGSRADLGRVYESVGYVSHIIEPRITDKALEKQIFAEQITEFLEEKYMSEQFDELIIIAPPAMLGALRIALSESLRDIVTAEINKEFIHLTVAQIEHHLEMMIDS